MSLIRRHRLIVRYFGGAMSEREQQELFERMAHDPKLKELFEEQQRIEQAMQSDRDAVPGVRPGLPPALMLKLTETTPLPLDGLSQDHRMPKKRPRSGSSGGAGQFGGMAILATVAAVGALALLVWFLVSGNGGDRYAYFDAMLPEDVPLGYDSNGVHYATSSGTSSDATTKRDTVIPYTPGARIAALHPELFVVDADSLGVLPWEILTDGIFGALAPTNPESVRSGDTIGDIRIVTPPSHDSASMQLNPEGRLHSMRMWSQSDRDSLRRVLSSQKRGGAVPSRDSAARIAAGTVH